MTQIDVSSEEGVLLEHRYLWLDGRANAVVEQFASRALPVQRLANTKLCFTGYAYASMTFPKEYDTMLWVEKDECVYDNSRDCVSFRPHHLASAIACRSRVIAATQQFGQPERRIPSGWKLISLIEFPDGVPDMVSRLPKVDSWFVSRQWVCLCSFETWAALVEKEPC